MSEKICSKCDGQMDNGYLTAHVRDSIDYTTLNPADRAEHVMMTAYACLDCGHVELSVGSSRLRQVTGK
jgi:hypothetical protein